MTFDFINENEKLDKEKLFKTPGIDPETFEGDYNKAFHHFSRGSGKVKMEWISVDCNKCDKEFHVKLDKEKEFTIFEKLCESCRSDRSEIKVPEPKPITISGPKWISVKDEFPEHHQKIIFYVEDRKECFCGFFEKNPEYRGINKNLKNIFYENLDNWWFEDESITYWAPLPEPPKD